MGFAGLTRAGTQLAGAESLSSSAAIGLAAPFLAVLYDPRTRAFNTAISMHPVDQAVAIALGVKLGSCTSAPKVGLAKPSMRNPGGQGAGGQSLQRRCYNAVVTALAALLASKDIVLVAVEPQLDPNATGRLLLAVTYKNLRLASLSNPQLGSQTVLTNAPGG